MVKILLDTDASIKLTKISIIETVTSGFEVILTSKVYREQVSAGLEKNIPDAKKMEKLVSEGKISVVEVTECYLVNQYSNGQITKGRLAELLDLDIYEVNELLEKYHIKSSISYERFTRGIKHERYNTRRWHRLKALPAHQNN